MRTMLEVERCGHDRRDEHLRNARYYRKWKSSRLQTYVARSILRTLARWMDLSKRVQGDGSEALLSDVPANRRS